MLEEENNVDQLDKNKWTPLMHAVADGNWKEATSLVRKGANVNYESDYPENVFSVLIDNYHPSGVAEFHKCLLAIIDRLDITEEVMARCLACEYYCPWMIDVLTDRFDYGKTAAFFNEFADYTEYRKPSGGPKDNLIRFVNCIPSSCRVGNVEMIIESIHNWIE